MTAPSTVVSPSSKGTASALRNQSGAFAWTGITSCIQLNLPSVSSADSQRALWFAWLGSAPGRTAVRAPRSTPSTLRVGRARARSRRGSVQLREIVIGLCEHVCEHIVEHDGELVVDQRVGNEQR